jgi:hypothetical protein
MGVTSTWCVAALAVVTGVLSVPAPQAAEPVVLSGTIWRDANANGLRDPGEPGMSEVGMGVLKPDGSLADSGYTAPDGRYRFEGMPPDTYRVAMLVPVGEILVRPNAGDDAADSDLGWTDATGEPLSCTGGDCAVVDAGLVPKATDLVLSAEPREIRLPQGSRAEVTIVVRNSGNEPTPTRITIRETEAGPVDLGTSPVWGCVGKGSAFFCTHEGLLEPGQSTPELRMTVPAQPDTLNLNAPASEDVNPADNEIDITITP